MSYNISQYILFTGTCTNVVLCQTIALYKTINDFVQIATQRNTKLKKKHKKSNVTKQTDK